MFIQHNKIEYEFSEKYVLYIPIFFAFNDQYDFAIDKNIDKFISKLYMCQNVDLDITIPQNLYIINKQIFIEKMNKLYENNNLKAYKLISTNCYATNALIMHMNYQWENFLRYILRYNKYDNIIFELPIIGTYITQEYYDKSVYWITDLNVLFNNFNDIFNNLNIPTKEIDLIISKFKIINYKNIEMYRTYVYNIE